MIGYQSLAARNLLTHGRVANLQALAAGTFLVSEAAELFLGLLELQPNEILRLRRVLASRVVESVAEDF